VTLEAVLDSNPNYSVLTQVRLTAAAAAETPVSAQVPKEKIQAITAPVVGRQSVASRTELPPLPGAVDAAPMLAKQTVASGAGLPPLPVAVNAAPVVAQQTVARSTGFTPAPNVVSAPPAVAQQTVARSTGFTPAPNVVSAPPAVAPLTAARSTDFTPVPNVVSAPPAAKTKKADRSGESISLGLVVGGAPVVTRGTIASSAQLPPLPGAVAAAPVVASKTVSISTELPALPRAVAAAPVVAKQNDVISRVVLPPMPGAVASLTPTSGRVFAGKTQQVTSPVDAKANTGVGAALLPMADAVAAAPTGTTGAGQHAPTVTYRDGQLTIDVENLTLAAVLKLIAEKTGAVIDVPPGSGQERIFEHAGPGRADDVLAQLLNGSHFNFIMVNSPQDPNAVAQVLLSVEQQGASPAAAPETEALAARMPEPVPSPNVNQKPAEGDTTLQPLPPPADVKPPAPENMSPDQRGEYMRSLFKKLTNQSSEQGSQTPPPAPPQ
jgi:hypothetical protein